MSGKLIARFGQLDIDHIPERVLRMIGNSYHGDVAFDANPLVVLTVVQLFRNIRH
jgi:hypothetical protein